MWDQTLLFVMKSLEDEGMGWWNEEGSWPGVIDEFVAFVRGKREGLGDGGLWMLGEGEDGVGRVDRLMMGAWCGLVDDDCGFGKENSSCLLPYDLLLHVVDAILLCSINMGHYCLLAC